MLDLTTSGEQCICQEVSAFFGIPGVQFWVKRDDLLHPIAGGNKLRKLLPVVQHANRVGAKTLVSLGGKHSNHLPALAWVAAKAGMQAVGLVRGWSKAEMNSRLLLCKQLGMHLIGVERHTYRTDPFHLFEQIAPDFEEPFYIPEGGAVWEALPGMLPIWHELQAQLSLPATHLLLAIGTGTTFAGLVKGATQMGLQTAVWGIVALKVPPAEQPGSFAQFLDGNVPLPHQLLWNHHGGGYAKTTPSILETTKAFETQTGIPLDPVYTAKVVAATQQLANEGAFAPGSRVVLLHTGGIFN